MKMINQTCTVQVHFVNLLTNTWLFVLFWILFKIISSDDCVFAFKMFRLVQVLICYSDDEVFLLTVTWPENFWNELLSRCYPFSMHQTLIQRASNSGWNAFHRQTSNRRLYFIPVGPTHNCVIWQDVVWTNGVTVAQSNFWYKYGS